MADVVQLTAAATPLTAPIGSVVVTVYPREKLDEERVELFAELLKTGHVFDPVKVVELDKVLYLLDGCHRVEAHKKAGQTEITYEIHNVEKKYWLLEAGRLNGRSSKPLATGEIKQMILRAYQNDGVTPEEIFHYLKDICSKSWIYKTLAPIRALEKDALKQRLFNLHRAGKSYSEIEKLSGVNRATAQRWVTQNTEIRAANGGDTDPDHGVKAKQRNLENAGDETADDNLDGNSANHQTPPCNVQRGLINETPGAIQYNDDGFSNHNRESWYHLKKNVESFYDWKTNDETTLFCLHEINHSVPIKAICQMSETSQGCVQRIALALLCFYHYEDMSVSQVVAKTAVSEDGARFISWLFAHLPNVIPSRKVLFDWILANLDGCRFSKEINTLIRKEKLYWHFISEGQPVPWENKTNRLVLTKEDLPLGLFETLQSCIETIMELKTLSRGKKWDRIAVEMILEPLNRMQITINDVRDFLRTCLR
jgi:hypothetical protein